MTAWTFRFAAMNQAFSECGSSRRINDLDVAEIMRRDWTSPSGSSCFSGWVVPGSVCVAPRGRLGLASPAAGNGQDARVFAGNFVIGDV